MCCVFVVRPGGNTRVQENNTYIQNPSFPSADVSLDAVTFVVTKTKRGMHATLNEHFELFLDKN